MVNSAKGRSSRGEQARLARWIAGQVGIRGLKVKYRLQGNNLHILCEGTPCPSRETLLLRLLTALQKTDINTLLPPDYPPVYQVFLHGRVLGHEAITWTQPIFLNQIEQHLEQFWQERATSTYPASAATATAQRVSASSQGTGTALVLSNRSQAQRGNIEAIARYLSETLSAMGVAVRVSVKTIPYQRKSASISLTHRAIPPDTLAQRLCISCESPYSPDPLVLGEPIAQKLRELELDGFRDAIIAVQVRGEEQPDWTLQVDLTPTKEILREWGRWGDVEALSRLLKLALGHHQLDLSTLSLNDATLHIFCGHIGESRSVATPTPEQVEAIVSPMLELLGPQGIHAAALYGVAEGRDTPEWVRWIDLPAAKHFALAESPFALAQQGDWPAIAFLIERLLNPNLDPYLATGGIRTQLLPKGELLHIMTDAAICPSRERVCSPISQFLKQIKLPGISGVRIYGRRAGQRHPAWSYGLDFVARPRMVPEAAPEFAATDAYVADLIAQPGEPILRRDLTADDVRSFWGRLQQQVFQFTERILVRSQLFVPMGQGGQLVVVQPTHRGRTTALVWAGIGVLMVVQADWLLHQWAQRAQRPQANAETAVLPPPNLNSLGGVTPNSMADAPAAQDDRGDAATAADGSAEESKRDGVFNSSGFTRSDELPTPQNDAAPPTPPTNMPYTEPSSESQAIAAAVLAEEMPFSTFNSHQLDQKLLLYRQQLETAGLPDVLVIGSSRALRGVDPVALRERLAELGYDDVDVFNFGVNGATAQVVELILLRLLTPDQLPPLIIWADGARAFNSGSLDITFNGIVASEGYRDLADGKPPLSTDAQTQARHDNTDRAKLSITESYERLDRWLSDQLANLSSTFTERDRVKHLLQTQLTGWLPEDSIVRGPDPTTSAVAESQAAIEGAVSSLSEEVLVDEDGFLPLSVRFNPATYFQTYARVSGEYDSDYQNFQLLGTQEQALDAIVEFTHKHDISLVFVNLPLTDEYLDPTRMQYEQDFKRYMVGTAVSQGLIFRDLSEDWLTQYDFFSDPSHLNRYGAYQVSQTIAQDPMIPWNKANP